MKLFVVASLIVCLAGVTFRVSRWFSREIRPSGAAVPTDGRVASALSASLAAIFSLKFFRLLQAFFLDILLQFRSFDKSILRWSAHFLIFSGFLLLFFLHALGYTVAEALFGGYYPTLSPYLFLRNFFGLMVLAGVGIAAYRRISWRRLRLKNDPSDWLALFLIALIILSGFMLESTKIASYSVYENMVQEYGDVDDEESRALEAYWAVVNGVQSPNITTPVDRELLELGGEAHENNCMDCHAPAKNAFISFTAAKIMGPATSSGSEGAVNGLLFLHILACLVFLVWLPFSKMFHIVSAPVMLIVRRITGLQDATSANALTRQMIGLSACTHCGACSVECSAVMYFESFQNDFILPSEKVRLLQRIATGKKEDSGVIKKLQKGLYLCTSCDRCSIICPSGVNLREIFVNARYALLEKGAPETSLLSHFSFPLALAQNYTGDHLKALKKVETLFKNTIQTLCFFLPE